MHDIYLSQDNFKLLSEFRHSTKFSHITTQCVADEGEQVPLKKELEAFCPKQVLLVFGDAESWQPDGDKVVTAPWNQHAATLSKYFSQVEQEEHTSTTHASHASICVHMVSHTDQHKLSNHKREQPFVADHGKGPLMGNTCADLHLHTM